MHGRSSSTSTAEPSGDEHLCTENLVGLSSPGHRSLAFDARRVSLMIASRRPRIHFAWRRGRGCKTRCHELRSCRSTRGSRAANRTAGNILLSCGGLIESSSCPTRSEGSALDVARLARRATRERRNCRSLATIGERGFDRRLAPPFARGMGGGRRRGGSASSTRSRWTDYDPSDLTV